MFPPDQLTRQFLAIVSPYIEFHNFTGAMLAGPVILSAIALVHWLWFRRHCTTDGQQRVELTDFSDLNPDSCAALPQQLTLVDATNTEFNADGRTSARLMLALPSVEFDRRARSILRVQRAQIAQDLDVAASLICSEDLDVRGTSHFLSSVKVGGDLVIRGNATFFSAVIVNGVLRVEGHAHFAEGLIVKGETYVTGELSIGSQERRGWAALAEFSLATRLRLNGRVVTTRAIQVRKAA